MKTRYNAWIDGISLQDIDPTIIITDIEELNAEESFSMAEFPVRDGSRLISRRRTALRVRLRFMVREYSTARRKDVLAKVCTWARGRVLTVSDRPGQELRVVCEQFPVVSSSLKWTDKLEIQFAAYEMPYWTDGTIRAVTFSGSSGLVKITPGGNAETRLEMSVKNRSGSTVDTLRVSVNDTVFLFSSLGLSSSETLEISYDDRNLQRMTISGVSVMSKRAPESSDDLVLLPGVSNQVQISASGSVDVILKARGIWL